jgi:hypothetical protein
MRSTIGCRGGSAIAHSKRWRNNQTPKTIFVAPVEANGIAPEESIWFPIAPTT